MNIPANWEISKTTVSRVLADGERVGRALELASQGAKRRDIAAALGVKHYDMVRICKEVPAFGRVFLLAQEAGLLYLSDKLRETPDEMPMGDPHLVRIHYDNLKWLLERLYPAVFRASVDINVTGKLDIGQALEEAKARARTINVTPQQLSSSTIDPFEE